MRALTRLPSGRHHGLGRLGFLLLAALAWIAAAQVASAAFEPLGILLGQKTLEAYELRFLLDTKAISREDYTARLQQNQAAIRLINQQVAKQPRKDQGDIRKTAKQIVDLGVADLARRRQQYVANERARQAQEREQAALARQQAVEEQRQQQAQARQQAAEAKQQQALDRQQALEQQRQAQQQQQQAAAERQRQLQLERNQAEARQQANARQQAGQQRAGQQPAETAIFQPKPQRPPRNAQEAIAAGQAVPGVFPQEGMVVFNPPPQKSYKGYLWWLVLIPIGGALYFFWVRRQRPGGMGHEAPPARRPPAAREFRSRESFAELPQSAVSNTAAAVEAAGGGYKELLFAQQRDKYQAGINAVIDELTRIQQELASRGDVPGYLRDGLRDVGGTVFKLTRAQVKKRHGRSVKALLNAALLMPVWRLFRHVPLILKIVMGFAVLWLVNTTLGTIAGGDWPLVIILYLLTVGIFFFFERRAQGTGPLGQVDANATTLKQPVLYYAYPRQQPRVEQGIAQLQALRVSSAQAKPLFEEATLTVPQPDLDSDTGTCYVGIGDLATWQIEPGAAPALVHRKVGNALIDAHGETVHAAMLQAAAGLDPLIETLRSYGDVKWLERRQRAEIPRLENLIENVERIEQIWRPVAVSQAVLDFLLRRIDLFNLRDRATPAGLLLHGYPGNGKEYLARKVAESSGARFVKLSASQLSSAKDVKELWNSGKGDAVVLFVEHADGLFAKPGSPNDAGSREGTLAWLEEWGRNEPWASGKWVVMTAQSDQALHPRVLAQFGSSKIEVTAPDPACRGLVLAGASAENSMPGAVPAWVIERTSGASIRELREIVKETRLHSLPHAPTDDHWRAAMGTVRGADSSFRDEKKTWDRLVLPADVKDQLKRAARILREADRYKDKKVNIPNLLLFGPPGTGKTDIARTFANDGGVKFIAASTADLKSSYQAQSAHQVRDLFARARASAPCVLFIDEIETVAAKREGGQNDSATTEIVTEMLAQMDGAAKHDRPVIVLAATNLPEQIDKAILSRFTSRIEIPLPDEAGRRELLARLLSERPLDPALDVEEITAFLAKRLNRRSGRDLVMIVNRAMERAVAQSDSPDDVRLTRELLMAEAMPRAKELPEAELQRIWAQIVLQPAVKQDVLDKIRMFNRGDKAAPRGLLLYGPPGTGKTEIARRIADSAQCHFMSLKGPDLKAGHIGQTGGRVKGIWEQARARGRCVIFIDECEGVFARRGGTNTDSFGEELVQAFLAEWDGMGSEDQQVWVIGATNRRELLDEAIVSRFGAAIEIGMPGAEERLQILRLEMEKLERQAELPAFLGKATSGLSGRTLATVAREVCVIASRDNSAVTEAMWREVLKRHAKASSESVDEDARWDSLIVSETTMQKLKATCESLRHVETLRKQGIAPPQGALLYGPPGTGKTQIARTLANESGLPFIAATTAEIKAGFIGQSGGKARELFERARSRAPCILFIDEIDAIAPNRGGAGSDSFTNEIVNQLLQEMDGVRKSERHVFVLAATNLPESVDPAIRSRLKDQIEIPKPDADQRRRMFTVFIGKQACDFDVAELALEMARRTPEASGRDIAAIVERAKQGAASRAIGAGTEDKVTLTRADLLQQVAPKSSEMSEADVEKIWSRIVLDPAVKRDILGKLRLFNQGDKAAPRGLLLSGPPGTGKTEIARLISASAGCHFISLSLADIKGAYVGESGQKVRKIWEQARARGRCIIFVDECEGGFARRGSPNSDSASQDIVQSFLAEWDGVTSSGQIWVVGATNRHELIDDAILSRFGAMVRVEVPDAAARLEILKLHIEKMERHDVVPEFVGKATTGLSGRALFSVVRDLYSMAGERQAVVDDALWREVLKKHTKAASESVDEGASWDSLILPEDTLEKLRTVCSALQHVETLKKQGFDVPRAVLLYGPPGTGKTQIARTLANESGLPFLAAATADIKAGFVGQSVQKVRELFERARSRAPCVLFIDELEAVTPIRGGPNADAFAAEIVNQLLQELDGVRKTDRHVFLLAATNLKDQIDPAILSRFEEKIEIGNPDASQRVRLIRTFVSKMPAQFDVDSVAHELAEMTANVSGRDLRAIVNRAAQKAIGRALRAGKPDAIELTRDDLMSSAPARNEQRATP